MTAKATETSLKALVERPISEIDENEIVNWAPPCGRGLWHLSQMVSGTERHLIKYMKRNRFGAYFPMMRVMKPVPKNQLSAKQRKAGANVLRPKIEPLLKGYILVHFDPYDDRRHDIFDYGGVRGLVCAGDKPYQVPGMMIDDWRNTEIDGALPGRLTVSKLFNFALGDKVRLKGGAFVDYTGVIDMLPKDYRDKTLEEIDDTMRAIVLIEAFGGFTKLDVPFGEFEKV
jgi:transcription antitermination factor NusG